MKIAVLSSSQEHPIYSHLQEWVEKKEGEGHDCALFLSKKELLPADLLLLISCSEMIEKEIREKYKKTLLVLILVTNSA